MIKPMLAHKVNDQKIDFNEPVFIQPKLDGVRCLFTKDGAYSRTGKQFYNLQHIELKLSDFFSANPDVVLDGELYNHELRDDFEQIISLVRKQKPTHEDRLNAADVIQRGGNGGAAVPIADFVAATVMMTPADPGRD